MTLAAGRTTVAAVVSVSAPVDTVAVAAGSATPTLGVIEAAVAVAAGAAERASVVADEIEDVCALAVVDAAGSGIVSAVVSVGTFAVAVAVAAGRAIVSAVVSVGT